MTPQISIKNRCRLCSSTQLRLAVNIAASPIADAYVPKEKLYEPQELYPLDLFLCMDCGHVQNLHVLEPDFLFKDYTFFTSNFKSLVSHFEEYSRDLVAEFYLKKDMLAVEVGSNDGTFLLNLAAIGMRTVGVDPSTAAAALANERGVKTIEAFFTEEVARRILSEHGRASVVIANNVFAHSDDLNGFVRAVEALLDHDGVFVFEVSYLGDIVDGFFFDTVYHEHVSYHSVRPLETFLGKFGLQIFNIVRNSSKGGSIRCFVKRISSGRYPVSEVVEEFIRSELTKGLAEIQTFERFDKAIIARKSENLALLKELLARGKRIAGYGASTTVTTLIWHFELCDKLEFLVDDNPVKQNLFSPRSHLEVLPSSELINRAVDFTVVLAWNYADKIIANNKLYLERGGRFIVPLPDLKVVH
jgi:SAM-dependent methyltransferase